MSINFTAKLAAATRRTLPMDYVGSWRSVLVQCTPCMGRDSAWNPSKCCTAQPKETKETGTFGANRFPCNFKIQQTEIFSPNLYSKFFNRFEIGVIRFLIPILNCCGKFISTYTPKLTPS
jgi:hypothetical protein